MTRHGNLAKAGKVRKLTPKVCCGCGKIAKPNGRAHKRSLYNKRFLNAVSDDYGHKKGPNYGSGQPKSQLNQI